jgi:hypothetical protein
MLANLEIYMGQLNKTIVRVFAAFLLVASVAGCGSSNDTSLQPRTAPYRVGPPGSQPLSVLLDEHQGTKSQEENSKLARVRLMTGLLQKVESHQLAEGSSPSEARQTAKETIDQVAAVAGEPVEHHIDIPQQLLELLPPEVATAIAWVQNEDIGNLAQNMLMAAGLALVDDEDRQQVLQIAQGLQGNYLSRREALFEQQKDDREVAKAMDEAQANISAVTLPPPPRRTPFNPDRVVVEAIRYDSALANMAKGWAAQGNAIYGGAPTGGTIRGFEQPRRKSDLFNSWDGMSRQNILAMLDDATNTMHSLASNYDNISRQLRSQSFSVSAEAAAMKGDHPGTQKARLGLMQTANAGSAEARDFSQMAEQLREGARRLHQAQKEYFAYYAMLEAKELHRSANVNNDAYHAMMRKGVLRVGPAVQQDLSQLRREAGQHGFDRLGAGGQNSVDPQDVPRSSLRPHRIEAQVPVYLIVEAISDTGDANETQESFRSHLDKSAVAVKMGETREALIQASHATALEPQRWEPFFLAMAAYATAENWDAAASAMIRAMQCGYDASANPRYVDAIVSNLMGISDSDLEATTMEFLLQSVELMSSIDENIHPLPESVKQLLEAREDRVAGEALIAEQVLKAFETSITRNGEGSRHFQVADPSDLIAAWIGKDGEVTEPTVSLLRRISNQGGALLAYPDKEKGASFTRDDVDRELSAWQAGGAGSRWKLVWSTELASANDPYGHHAMREALAQTWRNKGSEEKVYLDDVTETIARLHTDWATTPSAPEAVARNWTRDRRDWRRSVFATELRAAPTSKTMWLALASRYDEEESGRPLGRELDTNEFCQTLATVLTQRHGLDVSAAALLAMADTGRLSLDKENEQWYAELLDASKQRSAK